MKLKFINIYAILLVSLYILTSCEDKTDDVVKTDGISWDINGDWFNVSRYPLLINSQYGRYSEGAFIQLNDNKVMAVYTRFDEGHEDHTPASIVSRISTDRGETWSEERILVQNTDNILNVMSASLVKLNNGNIGLVYLVKETIVNCYPVIRFSYDDGNTFSEPTNIIESGQGYFTLNNSRVLKLSNGRIIVPLSEFENDGVNLTSWKGKILYMYSDDNGASWQRSGYLKPCASDVTEQEPGIIELKDGSLMCYVRTNKGSQFISRSYDMGITWTDFVESNLVSPLSPATIVQVETGEKPLIAVWNNSESERKPLAIALSYDNGITWQNSQIITDSYSSYPSILAFEDGDVLIGYCWSDTFSYGLENYSIDKYKYIQNQ